MATIEARVTKVEQEYGNEWIRVHTDHPQIKRLDTKDESRAQQAVSARNAGEPVLINYTSREGRNVNPHTGRPYMNYYFDGILAGGAEARSNGHAQGIEVVQPGQATGSTRRTDPEDAWRMTLAKSAELAVRMLPLLKPEEQADPEQHWNLTLWWARRIYTTPPPSPVQARPVYEFGDAPASAGAPGAYSEPEPYAYDQPPPRTDDDIPF